MTDLLNCVPIITIGGFLGAGKTTLVNRILAQADGRRIVVFVNDFGSINIDYDLIEAADTDRISLKNGCVCCTLNDDLISSIVTFCREDQPDTIVIESSGVSNPRSLDQSIFALQSAGHVRLYNRIYVLDADQFGSLGYENTEILIDHAVASDLVLVNKSDLVSDKKLRALEATLDRSTGDTAVCRTTHCDVAIDSIFESNESVSFSCDGVVLADVEPVQSHRGRYHSWSKTVERPLRRETFQEFLRELSGIALRAKGTIVFDDDPTHLSAFDLVGNRMTNRTIGNCSPQQASKLVVIGKNDSMNLEELEYRFAACLAEGTV